MQRSVFKQAVDAYNAKISAALKAAAPTAKLVDFDTTMRTTIATRAAPFTNVVSTCIGAKSTCGGAVFYDDYHFTSMAHLKVRLARGASLPVAAAGAVPAACWPCKRACLDVCSPRPGCNATRLHLAASAAAAARMHVCLASWEHACMPLRKSSCICRPRCAAALPGTALSAPVVIRGRSCSRPLRCSCGSKHVTQQAMPALRCAALQLFAAPVMAALQADGFVAATAKLNETFVSANTVGLSAPVSANTGGLSAPNSAIGVLQLPMLAVLLLSGMVAAALTLRF